MVCAYSWMGSSDKDTSRWADVGISGALLYVGGEMRDVAWGLLAIAMLVLGTMLGARFSPHPQIVRCPNGTVWWVEEGYSDPCRWARL